MRKIDWLHHTSPHQFVEHIHEISIVTQPFTDRDILDIQEKFLSNGFQYLKVKNILQGRSIIHDFLNSLSLYNDIVCLTLANEQLREGVTNLYAELHGGDSLNLLEPYVLDEYFVEDFYFDFMWIEATKNLLRSQEFGKIKEKLIDTVTDQHIPILVFTYEDG